VVWRFTDSVWDTADLVLVYTFFGVQLLVSLATHCLDNMTQIWSDIRTGLVLCIICLVWYKVLSNWSICLSGIKYEMQVLISALETLLY